MTGLTAEINAPESWETTCAENGLIFHSRQWQQLLERSFRCRSLYAWQPETGDGAALTSFRGGPFSVGYLGFPFGGNLTDTAITGEFLQDLLQAEKPFRLVAIRIPVSAFGAGHKLDLPYETTQETAIADLQSWSLEKISTNMRRDVRQAQRSDLRLIDADDPRDGHRLFALYHHALKRNRGSLRYNADYFVGLIELAQQHAGLRVLLAKHDETIAAFTVVARHGATACYLHGATDWSLRKYQPSALLLNEAISWSQSAGCSCFNLMSSPQSQSSLIKYKERWGAQTREHRTYTLPVGISYPLFRLAERLNRLLR